MAERKIRFGTLGWSLIGLAVILSLATAGIFFVTHHFMREGFEDYAHKRMDVMLRVVDDYVRIEKNSLRKELRLISEMSSLREAILSESKERMRRVAMDIMEQGRATFVTLTDPKGNVLARAMSDASGDNIANTEVMKAGLAGGYTVDVARLKNNGLSIVASAPIYDKDRMIGAVLFGNALRTNAFVDEVKKVTDLDMTVFDGGTRIATTITRDGRRAVGTEIGDPAVAKRVLEDGDVFNADTRILGKMYKTVYWPVRDAKGDVLGMWFLGAEIDAFNAMVNRVSLYCLAGTFLIAVVLGVFGAVFFRSLIAPLRNKAFTDGLTGILNRAGIERYFGREFNNAPKHGAFFLMDLDHFKEVNDILGHPVGDELLTAMADLLKKVFRESDIIARLGGDEFAVYSPTLESMDVIEFKCQSILQGISCDLRTDDGKMLHVTTSIGVSLCPRDGEDLDTLYKYADKAMYDIKNDGRNGFRIFQPK